MLCCTDQWSANENENNIYTPKFSQPKLETGATPNCLDNFFSESFRKQILQPFFGIDVCVSQASIVKWL